MMKQVIKTVITVFVAIVCCIVCLMAALICYEEVNFLNYEVSSEHLPSIMAVETEYIGTEYKGNSWEGFSYYRIYITLENKSNFGKNGSELFVRYDTESYDGNEEAYRIITTEKEYYGNYDNTDYFPAGRESTYRDIICIEDGCEGFEVYLWYRSDKKSNMMVDL